MVQTHDKQTLIQEFRQHDHDTGSAQVQIALLTARIQSITDHVRAAKKDHSSKRGLIKLVNQRRRLLDYLKKESGEEAYKQIIERLELRK